LDPGTEAGVFAADTEQALCEFQRTRGLHVDGRCDENTWASLVESSWLFGARALMLTSPNMRGDDVAELQSRLTRLGFDSGRVDGILGPDTFAALRAFQSDCGLVVDGVCGAVTATTLRRVSSQTGNGPGIAVIREREQLRALRRLDQCRVVVGQFGGMSSLTRTLTHRLRVLGATVMPLGEPDPVAQALAANEFRADVFIGFESTAATQAVIHYYQVPTFESAGGRALADAIATSLTCVDGPQAVISGKRLPVLRETRMPAVLCIIGPTRVASDEAVDLADATLVALEAWLSRAQ
jgi:N-acetylmuramoyl-L-alanine amidase